MERVVISYMIVNLVVFTLYGIDKYKAIHRQWRIPEATLLGAAVFGVFGALTGMYVWHHKTKKPKFVITVFVIAVIEIGVFLCVFAG